jgi:hypothetical protein
MPPADWRRPSVIALALANFIPLFGVLALDWDVFPLILLFWLENVVLGGFGALKLLTLGLTRRGQLPVAVLLTAFFCAHYGIFCAVHGGFVLLLFGREHLAPGAGPNLANLTRVVGNLHLGWALAAFVVSHGISFLTNFLRAGEYRRAELPRLMTQPYARIVVLHVSLLASGFILVALGSPTVGLILLLALKTILDLRAHLRERQRFSVPDIPPAGGKPAA